MQLKRIGIGLLGKGSTNHLHRAEVLRAFQENGFHVTFIVREDYDALLTRLTGCHYVACSIREESGWRGIPISFCQGIRFAYPSSDAERRRILLKRIMSNLRPWILVRNLISLALARFRASVLFAAWLEEHLFRPALVEGLDPSDYDSLLLLGILNWKVHLPVGQDDMTYRKHTSLVITTIPPPKGFAVSYPKDCLSGARKCLKM